MRTMHRPRVLAAVLVALLASLTTAAAPPSAQREREVSVMTRNLYLGTDLGGILSAGNVSELLAASSTAWARVLASDVPARADAMAGEIAAAAPALVGLQEATLYRTGPFDLGAPATTVVYDFTQLVVDRLGARGLHYDVAVTQDEFDGELPAFTSEGLRDIRLTDRDVILARADLPDSSLLVTNPAVGHFATNLVVSTPFGAITILRGWTALDAQVRGKGFRFVNTHLEAFADVIQRAQGAELRAGPLVTALPVVVVGDLNSPADGSGATYNDMVAAGFSDAWPAVHPAAPGFTCCQAADLRNATSQLDERIDLVLFRGAFHAGAADVVGDEPADRTPSGLWPSDHAGVSAALFLPRPGRS